MKFIDYLQEQFPTLALVPSIYNQWNTGIHFTLGGPIYQFNENGELNLEMFELVYKQTIQIFNELFDQTDDIFLVTNVYKNKTNQKRTNRLKVYKPFIKNRMYLNQIQVKTLPYPFEVNEGEEYEMQQFSLLCKPCDLRITELLKAACNEDFPLKPRYGGYPINYPDVFFVNVTKDIIFFVYDDRGCEVIALNLEQLLPLYEKYYDWIEKVDRQKFEQVLTGREM